MSRRSRAVAIMRSLVTEAASALSGRAARLRAIAGLSLPCHAGADAATADRHRPLQIYRIQAERAYQGGEEPGLLETRAALSRCHRVHNNPEHGDPAAGLCRGQTRPVLGDATTAQGCKRAGATGEVRLGDG